MRPTTVRFVALALASLVSLSAPTGCSDSSSGQAGTVHIRGVVYAFFGIDDHLPGSVIRIDEYPQLEAPVAADGSYDIEVPDDALVTPYIVPPTRRSRRC
jgi:hypothetical protein